MQFFVNKTTEVFKNNQILNEHISNEVRKFLTELLEAILEEELKIQIGRNRYERRKEKDLRIYRNGYRVRNYLSIWSKLLRLMVPRTRSANFTPLLFQKGGISSQQMDRMLIQLWTEGGSYRDIVSFVKKIYGEHFSLSMLSGMIKRIEQECSGIGCIRTTQRKEKNNTRNDRLPY